MRTFPHERLEAYRLARELTRLMRRVFESLPRRSALTHNMQQHVVALPLNIARGTAELTRGDAIWSFRVARRAAFDLQRQLRFARGGRMGDQAAITAAIEIAERVRGQLTADIEMLTQGLKPWARTDGG